MSCYDEGALLHETALELGIEWHGRPWLERIDVPVAGGRVVSALRWGEAPPALVLLHGGAQNAHTWDGVALALGCPLLAVDLPGHGHSSWRDDADYSPASLATDVAVAVRALAPEARAVVGMSLGGLCALALAGLAPDLVRRLALVDVTPGTDREKAAPILAFVGGRRRFDSFADLLAYTVAGNPTRSEASLRRGVLHNAREEPDGTWVWRHHLGNLEGTSEPAGVGIETLWDTLGALTVPVLLVRGSLSSVVADADVAELRRRLPGAGVEVVDGAGHSIQGDRPTELAAIIAAFAAPA